MQIIISLNETIWFVKTEFNLKIIDGYENLWPPFLTGVSLFHISYYCDKKY